MNHNDIRYPEQSEHSEALYERALRVLPSGNSRQTVFFRPFPIYAASGDGFRVVDVDGVERIDFINNYSALIHGHRPKRVMDAVADQLTRLTAVGLPTESEIALAELLVERLPGVEQVRFANSGTEAVMMAIKAARAYTRRPKIAKVEGTYHGSYDFAEVSQNPLPSEWGPADRPASAPNYEGQPPSTLADVVVLPWNNVPAARALLLEHASDLAGVLIDALPSRMAYVPVAADYLKMIRDTTREIGALFILDEVYSLRFGYHGAQGTLGVTPDLTSMGKIIGGGFPVGGIGGSRDVMSVFDVDKGRPRVPHGGTYNANPVTMVAGLESMKMLTPDAFDHLNRLGERMRQGLRECLKIAGRDGQARGQASFCLLSLYGEPITAYRDLMGAAKFVEAQAKLHRHLMNNGVFTSPTLSFTMSTPMTDREIDFTLEQVLTGLRAL
ncbi:MAG TPA: aminotransferase class III-fold pyridoxal phosphate-dependent enzyme [Rhizomicrobium sp.]|nr:aminotransferase class III-fold pyridoxal phosphate-dependent enzyme [Rhizomicrobium sp.]